MIEGECFLNNSAKGRSDPDRVECKKLKNKLSIIKKGIGIGKCNGVAAAFKAVKINSCYCSTA